MSIKSFKAPDLNSPCNSYFQRTCHRAAFQDLPKSGIYVLNRKHPLSRGFLALLRFDGCLCEERAAALLGARVSLIHVSDPGGYNGLQLYVRPITEVLEEHLSICRERLDSFLTGELPVAECPRILTSGDAATEIARVARESSFDLIIMPTHAGKFRQMLLGSTTAKVINDADCPVLTSRHAETIAPRPLDTRNGCAPSV
jgi:nucleotide-binding universal stress UspA family protein